MAALKTKRKNKIVRNYLCGRVSCLVMLVSCSCITVQSILGKKFGVY